MMSHRCPSFLQRTSARSTRRASSTSRATPPAVALIEHGIVKIAGGPFSSACISCGRRTLSPEPSAESILRGRKDHARLMDEFGTRLAGIQNSSFFIPITGETISPGPSTRKISNSSPACNFPQSAVNLTLLPGTIYGICGLTCRIFSLVPLPDHAPLTTRHPSLTAHFHSLRNPPPHSPSSLTTIFLQRSSDLNRTNRFIYSYYITSVIYKYFTRRYILRYIHLQVKEQAI